MGSLPPSSTTPSSNLPTTAIPLISPSALLSVHLSQSPPRRPSGRTPNQPRPISLNTSSLTHAHGSSIVKIGSSTLVCGVRGEILPISEIPSWSVKDSITSTTEEWEAAEAADEDPQHPPPDQEKDDPPNEDALWQHNLLVPNLSLDTGCSPLHPANTAPSTEQQSLSQRLLSLLLTSKIVRLRDLEIYQHHSPPTDSSSDDVMHVDVPPQPRTQSRTLKAFWTLYIDILCISHSGTGSVFDAAWLALSAALRSTVLPHAEWDADLGKVVCFAPGHEGKKERRLRLRGMPVGLSWGVFTSDLKNGAGGAAGESRSSTLLVDLDTGEEEVCQEQGSVVVDVDGSGKATLLRVEKSGGSVAEAEELQQIVQAAEGRWREWRELMKGIS